jgi:dienelactone hydrolase
MGFVRSLACFFAAFAGGCVGSSPCSAPKRPLAFLPTPDAAGPQELWETDATQQTQSSRWYIELAGEPLTLALTADATGAHVTGTATGADGSVDTVDHAVWDATTGVLDFRRVGAGYWQWVHARAVEGVLTGRASYSTTSPTPPTAVADFGDHVIGWNDYYFSHDIVPRVFDLDVDGRSARLRLDRDASGTIVGRFKVYADDASGIDAEEVEYDVAVQAWDGHQLTFVRSSPAFTQRFDATVDGRILLGTMQSSETGAPVPLDGTRAELVGYGLAPRDAVARADWQLHARRQLAHLMMADNPAPLSLSVDRQPSTPTPDGGDIAPDRDDDADDWAATYSVDELKLQATLPNPYGGDPLSRAMHGFITTPSGDAPASGWPAVVVLNGHDGSALGTLDPDEPMYWYGDAWARRGYVVLTLDIGHRPLADRAALYRNYVQGDQPDDGNGPHPAIAATGLDSDWAEDGERAWDVERAVDYLLTLGNVDGARIAVTGLSLGGEIASVAGALDSRFAAVIPAGFVPDLTVMAGNNNHPCWRWLFGDPLDYFSVSDLHALIAPRPLVVETGAIDVEFSKFWPPFVDGKEVTRRSRAAYADAPSQIALYLHDGGHEYRFGDIVVADGTPASYVTVPAVNGPRTTGDLSWASDGSTVSLSQTLADALAGFLPPPSPP